MEDRKIRILLVEDDESVAQTMRELMKRLGSFVQETVRVGTLAGAMEAVSGSAFDVVILDLGLPDSQGLDTFLQLHGRIPRVPIVVSTGLDDENLAMKAVREGAQDYLVKGSVDGPTVVRTIRYAVERSRVETRPAAGGGSLDPANLKRINFPNLPDPLGRMSELAYNLWFSWHHEAYRLFRHLDIKLWEDVRHNPVQLLKELDRQRFEEVLHESVFMTKYHCVLEAFDRYMGQKETRFALKYPDCVDRWTAYFSMEFGIHESLPIYSGGLGILAGDHLKSASDQGVPLVGVGLLYRESYFTQFISLHGNQQSVYEPNNFSNLPVLPVLREDGKPLTVRVRFDHSAVSARVWKAEVGRVPLYLLDTDFQDNTTSERKITERLYVSDRELRLTQEMLLGIGGMHMLEAVGIRPAVWHLNEGHCALSSYERMRDDLAEGTPLAEAVKRIRPSTVFTTHTPIAAGNEVFETGLVDHLLGDYRDIMKISKDDFFGLARDNRNPDPNAFNMTILALKTASYANAVSELHGIVSRRMWHSLWPDRPAEEAPITHITNGVHTRTWMSSLMKGLLDEHLGEEWRYSLSDAGYWKALERIPDETLWKLHHDLKFRLIEQVRRNLSRQRERNGESPESVTEARRLLNPDVLTIGFARRFTPYKRGTLMFRNRDWLKYILSRENMPVQIVFAGKAHPADQTGKALIQNIVAESRNPEFGGKIVFVENYDMSLSKILVSGVDVWLNLPRRPLEASGTSGMKAAANGAINCSVMDGWWREAYDGTNGWAVGEDKDYYNEMEQDGLDAESLYRILQDDLVPLYYKRDESGLPTDWIRKMKRSMETVIPRFSTCRMIEEYVDRFYVPAMRGGK
jgi:glycogen phosphorylase